MFRLPCLLGPPIAPTAAALVRRAAGPFTPRNEPGITPRSCGIATCLMRATGTVGLAPTGLWPCRPLHIRRPARGAIGSSGSREPAQLVMRFVVEPDIAVLIGSAHRLGDDERNLRAIGRPANIRKPSPIEHLFRRQGLRPHCSRHQHTSKNESRPMLHEDLLCQKGPPLPVTLQDRSTLACATPRETTPDHRPNGSRVKSNAGRIHDMLVS